MGARDECWLSQLPWGAWQNEHIIIALPSFRLSVNKITLILGLKVEDNHVAGLRYAVRACPRLFGHRIDTSQ